MDFYARRKRACALAHRCEAHSRKPVLVRELGAVCPQPPPQLYRVFLISPRTCRRFSIYPDT